MIGEGTYWVEAAARLPKPYKRVLVCYLYGMKIAECAEGGGVFYFRDPETRETLQSVTHWLAFPLDLGW